MKTELVFLPAVISLGLSACTVGEREFGAGEVIGTFAGVAAGYALGSTVEGQTKEFIAQETGATVLGLAGGNLGRKADGKDPNASTKQILTIAASEAAGAGLGAAFDNKGSRIEGAIIGSLPGALVGTHMARQMDKDENNHTALQTGHAGAKPMEHGLFEALEHGPSHIPFEWQNPYTGETKVYTPGPAFRDASGRTCRSYEVQAKDVAAAKKAETGTACRGEGSYWQMALAK